MSYFRKILLCGLALSWLVAGEAAAESRVVSYFGYSAAIEISNGSVTVVLCPEVGGRVLEYSLNGQHVLYLSDREKNWVPGQKPASSAGRFDIGPELVIPSRPTLWSGEWSSELTGPFSVRLTSQPCSDTGVQLVRDFQLATRGSHLKCTQTIRNVSPKTVTWCHWSRTFAVGKGIVVIPLNPSDQLPSSRFPSQYAMYESRGVINVMPSDPAIRRVRNTLEIHPTPAKPKLGFDSYAGKIAYLAPNNLLFVKTFQTYPDKVYNEAAGLTISVWYPNGPMVELEPIGPGETLKPGGEASFTEDWYLKPMSFPSDGLTINHDQLETVLKAIDPQKTR